ncbi:MAG: hypothetical protein R6X18_09965 [Chloroflexota bacterium]
MTGVLFTSELLEPLDSFAGKCCVPSIELARLEGPTQLHFADDGFSSHGLTNLSWALVRQLQDGFGEALKLQIVFDDLPLLNLDQITNEKDLENCLAGIGSYDSVSIRFELDKRRLIEIYDKNGILPSNTYLYFYADAFKRALQERELSRLEDTFWSGDPLSYTLFLLIDRDIRIKGPLLGVFGGRYLGEFEARLNNAIDERVVPAGQLPEKRPDVVIWEHQYVSKLTPYQLMISVADDDITDKAICPALGIRFMNLALLYLAERSHSEGNRTVSRFITPSSNIEIFHRSAADTFLNMEYCGLSQEVADILEWTYASEWPARERLRIVQMVMAHALRDIQVDDRYTTIVSKLSSINEAIQLNWKAFIEGEFENYIEQVQVLETYVAKVIEAYSEQISEMVKSLSDTMLAAVAVLVGSMIAALFKDEFNAQVFMFGMLAYAGYVFVFPLLYNMISQWNRYQAAKESFETRKGRYETRLSNAYVERIVGSEVSNAEKRFKVWFRLTVFLYMLIIILTVAATYFVPTLFKTS